MLYQSFVPICDERQCFGARIIEDGEKHNCELSQGTSNIVFSAIKTIATCRNLHGRKENHNDCLADNDFKHIAGHTHLPE